MRTESATTVIHASPTKCTQASLRDPPAMVSSTPSARSTIHEAPWAMWPATSPNGGIQGGGRRWAAIIQRPAQGAKVAGYDAIRSKRISRLPMLAARRTRAELRRQTLIDPQVDTMVR